MTKRILKRRDFLAGCAIGAVTPLAVSAGMTASGPTIDCDFPGGNIIFERIDGDDVYLHQDPRDTEGFWFYWYFRVRGAAGRKLRFHFTKGNVLTTQGPAVSVDGGKNWVWLGKEAVDGTSFVYEFPKTVESTDGIRFCLAAPYQEANFKSFYGRHADSERIKIESHCMTRKGRIVERVRAGLLDGEPKHRVLLTARHHCCEMMASWALEGILEAVISDTPVGRWFQANTEVLAIPFMDKDGVEDGDQGKNRRPHDHNRDYLGKSIYPSVAALREFAPRWSAGRLRLALDMHCPYIRGGGDGPSSNERIFLVGSSNPVIALEQLKFGRILQASATGPLPYHTKHNIPWGQKWNTLKVAKSCSRWAAGLPGMKMATTVEIPYASVGERQVTAPSARLFGYDIARAIMQYLG